MSKKKEKKPDVRWPKKERLQEAVSIVWNFQQMCKLQMDKGYMATMDYPTKHHINKILAVEYHDQTMLEEIYGSKLLLRAKSLVPVCKAYLNFIKEYHDEVGTGS